MSIQDTVTARRQSGNYSRLPVRQRATNKERSRPDIFR